MAVWAAHETEQLINLVRQNHTLYDPSSNDYRNRDVLKTLWNSIAYEMNRSGRIFLTDMDCRDRWNSLRDGYRRFVKEEQIPSNGSKPKKKKTWHWSEAMSFLKPYIQERTPSTVIASADAKRCSSGAGNTVPIHLVSNDGVPNNVTASAMSNGIVSDDCSQDENSLNESSNNSVPVSKWPQTPSNSIETTTTATNISPIVISHHPAQPQDPDEQFFRSLLPDVKVLSPRQRGIFKIQVQQLLQEMLFPKECVGVTNQHTSSSTSQSPASVYGAYGNVYTSERWSPSVQSSCEYNKAHSS